jgi:hypothetical protein
MRLQMEGRAGGEAQQHAAEGVYRQWLQRQHASYQSQLLRLLLDAKHATVQARALCTSASSAAAPLVHVRRQGRPAPRPRYCLPLGQELSTAGARPTQACCPKPARPQRAAPCPRGSRVEAPGVEVGGGPRAWPSLRAI